MNVDKTFVPDEDAGFLQVFFNGPEGSSTAESLKSFLKAEKILANHKDISGFLGVIGWGGDESVPNLILILKKN